jgi:hypothetical protein
MKRTPTKRLKLGLKRLDKTTAEIIGRSTMPANKLAFTYNVCLATVYRCRIKYRQENENGIASKKQPGRCAKCRRKIVTAECLACKVERG